MAQLLQVFWKLRAASSLPSSLWYVSLHLPTYLILSPLQNWEHRNTAYTRTSQKTSSSHLARTPRPDPDAEMLYACLYNWPHHVTIKRSRLIKTIGHGSNRKASILWSLRCVSQAQSFYARYPGFLSLLAQSDEATARAATCENTQASFTTYLEVKTALVIAS
eukprot:6150324-Amphidinium_carterae.1